MSMQNPHTNLRETALTMAINDGLAPRDVTAVIKRAQVYLDFLSGASESFKERYPFTSGASLSG